MRDIQTPDRSMNRRRRSAWGMFLPGKLTTGLAATGFGVWLGYQLSRKWLIWSEKKVLITGASRGLGLVLARELAKAGAYPIICARDRDELYRAADELNQITDRVLAIPCDVTNAEDVEDMMRLIDRQWGAVDVLITNAGTISVGPSETMDATDFEHAMEANFYSALYPILSAVPRMRERGEGRIVNITSIGGKISVPHLLPYSASKFALVGLSEGLRAELAKDNITVTTVCPGLMRTGSPRHATFKGQHRAEYTWFSISDSLPILSMCAERAARQVMTACARGDAEVVLSLPAKFAAVFHGVFPGLTADVLGLINRLLPSAGDHGGQAHKGSESESFLSPSVLTTLSDRAAERNNQLAPETVEATANAGNGEVKS